jgi:hypothetical protein
VKARVALALMLLVGCGDQPAVEADPATAVVEPEFDPALLRELLGESVQIDGDRIRVDGMLIRLGFDPLIRQTGSVSVQLVQSQGYRLSGIADGSPLWLLGLRDGDVLTGVDKQAIIGREHELRSHYESRPSRVELTYLRGTPGGTESRTVDLRIAAGSAWRSGVASLDTAPPLRPPISPPATTDEPIVDPSRAADWAAFAAGLHCEPGTSADRLGRCEITRSALDELLAKPDSLMRQARIVPSMRNGETAGFKLYGIRSGSMPYLLGLKNGDMITAINGRALTSPTEALSIFEALKSETDFRVEIERKLQPVRLDVAIVARLSGSPTGLRTPPDLSDPFTSP